MVPAMTYSSAGNFFYMNGVFDMSWLPWIYLNIAPDARVRLGLPGAASEAEAAAAWEREAESVLSFLPLADLPILRDEAPFYFEWLDHEPTDPWWSWAEIRGRYARTDAAVLNISGWYDEAYGPEGAVTNHNGLVAARHGHAARSELILGPWMHGVAATGQSRIGELDFGPGSAIDYDNVLLDFFDAHLKRSASERPRDAAVRYFVMGSNEWRQAPVWPPEAEPWRICLQTQRGAAALGDCDADGSQSVSAFRADPADPVTDPYNTFGPHDYQMLVERDDLLIFETDVLARAVTIAGNASAKLFVSCNCPDFDLWVRLIDVYPDGRAINLMSPGADVQRVSYRDEQKHPPLQTGEIVAVTIDGLLTANRFDAGHRIRLQVSASFVPHLSRNLQTGLSETRSAASAPATIVIHHDKEYQSSLVLPVIE
jgi:putative CocE/NonD family hydrolase